MYLLLALGARLLHFLHISTDCFDFWIDVGPFIFAFPHIRHFPKPEAFVLEAKLSSLKGKHFGGKRCITESSLRAQRGLD